MHALSNNNIYNTRYISKSRDVSSGWRHSGWDFCPNTDGVALIVHVVPGLLKKSHAVIGTYLILLYPTRWPALRGPGNAARRRKCHKLFYSRREALLALRANASWPVRAPEFKGTMSWTVLIYPEIKYAFQHITRLNASRLFRSRQIPLNKISFNVF